MANGYNPQVPSPIAPMGEPSEKQKALLPLMNKMRQDMMAAGINPDDQMMPPNMTGTMPPGGGPPPPTMAPPPVSSGLPPGPTGPPLRPSNTMPSIAGPDSMPIDTPPIPRPQPASQQPPDAGLIPPANPAIQGQFGTALENQRLMGPYQEGRVPPPQGPVPQVGPPAPPQQMGPPAPAGISSPIGEQGVKGPSGLGGIPGMLGANLLGSTGAEGGEEDERKAALYKKLDAINAKKYASAAKAPEVDVPAAEDRPMRTLAPPGDLDALAKKDIAPPSPKTDRATTELGVHLKMSDQAARASVTQSKFRDRPAASFGSGGTGEGVVALSNMAQARQLGGIPADVGNKYKKWSDGKFRSPDEKKRWWLGQMVVEMRRIYDATPVEEFNEDDPDNRTPVYNRANKAKRQAAYDDLVNNFSSVMSWNNASFMLNKERVTGDTALGRKKLLLKMLTDKGDSPFHLGNIGAKEDNPAYSIAPNTKERDELIRDGLMSIIGNAYNPQPGPVDEPGFAERVGRGIRSLFDTDENRNLVNKPLVIQRAVQRARESGKGEDGLLGMNWSDPKVLTELVYMASDPKLKMTPGKRFKDHFVESLKLQKEMDEHTDLNALAGAWEEAMPGMGKKFAEHVINIVEDGSIDGVSLPNSETQLIQLKRQHILGLKPLPAGDMYSEEAGEGEIETVEVDGREYAKLGSGKEESPQYQIAVDPDTGEPIVDPETGDPLFDINITPLGGAITRDHPDFDESKAAPILNQAVAAASKKASVSQAQVAQAKQNKQKKVQRDEISDLEAEMGRIYDTDMAKRKQVGAGAPLSLSEEANSISKNILEREISTSNKKLDDQKFLLEFSKMFSTSLHQMGDSMIAMAAGLRPGEIKEYVPTSINEALTAVGAKKEAALMRLSTFAMTGHMFPQGTSAASMKAQMPMLQHSQNLQQKSEHFLAGQKQKTYESWLNYRKDVLGMKVDLSKEKWLRQKFEREFAHTREKDAYTYSLNRMKAQMSGDGTAAGNGAMSVVQLETIQALNATLDMGRLVLKEKPKFGTGWGINWWESLGNYTGWANPEWHSFKQMVTTQLNTYVNNLTGKQLSKHEVGRLKGAVPQISDDDAVFTEKAKTFIKIQEIVLARKLRTYAMAGMNMTGFMGDRQLSWKTRGGTERSGTYAQFRENLRRNPSMIGNVDILTGPQGKPQRRGDSYLADIVGGYMIQDPVTGELKYNEAEYGAVSYEAMANNPAFRLQRAGARGAAELLL